MTFLASLAADALVYGMIILTIIRTCTLIVKEHRRGRHLRRLLRQPDRKTVDHALYCLGHALNASTCKVLKTAIAQERPRDMCLALGTCGEYGMPSSHSMVWGFAISTLVRDRNRRRAGEGDQGPTLVLWVVVSMVVPVLRVVSGHHTIAQVVVGWLLGCGFGYELWPAFCLKFRQSSVFGGNRTR